MHATAPPSGARLGWKYASQRAPRCVPPVFLLRTTSWNSSPFPFMVWMFRSSPTTSRTWLRASAAAQPADVSVMTTSVIATIPLTGAGRGLPRFGTSLARVVVEQLLQRGLGGGVTCIPVWVADGDCHWRVACPHRL